MLSKKELRIFEAWQFFDRFGFFPFEKKRIDVTISGESWARLQNVENKSQFIDELIKEQRK